MAAPCPLLGDGITDDTLLNIARFLPTPKDLLCLKLTNSRFSAKIIATAPSGGAGGQRRQALSGGDAVHRGRGGAAVVGVLQRAGAWVGAASCRAGQLAVPAA